MQNNLLSSPQSSNSIKSQSISTQPTLANSPTQTAPSVKNSKNHTFSMNTIIPIIRTVKVNQYCYSVYSTLHKIPLAVHQFLDKFIMQGNANREGKDFYQQTEGVEEKDKKFYVDPSYYQKTNAYKNMSYDKGHMAPAKNYSGQQQLMDSTYTYANCIPQNSYFNRGSWKNLQSYCRNFIRQNMCDTIQIISGPVFYSGLSHKGIENLYENQQVVMLENGIVVPPKCYKVIKANVGLISYVAAFVLDNQKKIDNDDKIKNCVVQIDKLQYMTGLRFNLGKYRPLQQLDPTGMAKTFGDLHLQFYTKLFKFSKNIGDMNGAIKQGYSYRVKVDINAIPFEEKAKVAQVDYENTINQVGWTRTKAKSRRKINTLLGLHKDCTELQCLTKQLDQKIIKTIKDNLAAAKVEQQKQYSKFITAKLYKNNYKYHYPCEEQLKQIFPNTLQKTPKQSTQNNNDQMNENSLSQAFKKLTINEKNSPKTVKNSIFTPKKQKATLSKEQKFQQSQSSSAKNKQKNQVVLNQNIDEETHKISINLLPKQKLQENIHNQSIKFEEINKQSI